ncbi:hypothetical protein V2W45_1370344 [Cenococcum geophilum]
MATLGRETLQLPIKFATKRPLFYPLLLSIFPPVYCSLLTIILLPTYYNTTPYLLLKCLPIVYFALPIGSIALPLTLQQTVLELRIKPINLTRRKERAGPNDL